MRGLVQNAPIPGNTLGPAAARQFGRISLSRKEFRRQPAPARVLPWFEPGQQRGQAEGRNRSHGRNSPES